MTTEIVMARPLKGQLTFVSDVYAIWLRELKKHLAERGRLLMMFAPPLMWLGIIGVGLSETFDLPEELAAQGIDYLTFMAPGIIAQVALLSAMVSGISILWDKRFGFMREMLVAPIAREAILLGKLLGGATIALISCLLLFGLALAMGAFPFKQLTLANLGLALMHTVLIAVAFQSLGIALASRLSIDFFQIFWGILVLPLIFLSGAFYPLNLGNLPKWLEVAAWVDPLTYGVDGLRGALVGLYAFPASADLLIMLGFALLTSVTAIYLFRDLSAE